MNHFYLLVKPSSEDVKVIISVSKKVSKKAVTRNLVRRRVRPLVKEFIPLLKKGEYFVVAKPGAEKIKGNALKVEVAELFKKR